MSAPSRKPLARAEAEEMLAQLPPPWKMEGAKLIGEWRAKDFSAIRKLVGAIMQIAEEEDHHPHAEFGWNRCRAVFSTHRPPGLSAMDFASAKKLSQAAAHIPGVAAADDGKSKREA